VSDLFRSFRSIFQRIKHLVIDSGADDQRWRVREAQLHQSFGRDLFFVTDFPGHT
jgi:hypothetical protein